MTSPQRSLSPASGDDRGLLLSILELVADARVRFAERVIEGSLCFGVFLQSKQVEFARVVTDKATFAYLADVFILEPHRGKGLSKRLMQFIFAHPDLRELRHLMLATKDAHGLYEQFGFTELSNPARFMELHLPHVYKAL